MASILIITGGTGGHIFPAISIAKALQKRNQSVKFVVRQDKSDISLMQHYNFQYYAIPVSGFFGKRIQDKMLFIINFLRTMLIMPMIYVKAKPESVIASGGYPSLVPILWALLLHKKYFLIEQNRVPGRFTKYFARWAKAVFLGFPLSCKLKANTVLTGNAIMDELDAVHQYSANSQPMTVLVLGGSQGADFINQNVIEIALKMPSLNFVIQTGKRHYSRIRELLKSKTKSEPVVKTIENVEFESFAISEHNTGRIYIFDFSLQMEKIYKIATLVITRAGGMVLSEILSFGIPSIIIPFPFATDNHQAANAQFLALANAAIIIDQPTSSGISKEFIVKLHSTLESLINEKSQLTEMSKNALAIAKKASAQTIAQYICD